MDFFTPTQTLYEMDYAAGGQMWECLTGEIGEDSFFCHAGATNLSASVAASSLMMACIHPKHHERTFDFMPHHLLLMKIEDAMKEGCPEESRIPFILQRVL